LRTAPTEEEESVEVTAAPVIRPLAAQLAIEQGARMNSGGLRGFTVVTILTLIFAPFFSGHHWVWRQVDQTKQTQLVKCVNRAPCPAQQTVVNVVHLPAP
jgi:predicted transporter